MKQAVIALVGLALGAAGGYGVATMMQPGTTAAPPPERWVARVGGEYLSEQRFVDEMRQRGGLLSGQYQDPEQRRALLDALLYQKALVATAREEGIDRLPDVQRTLDQVLANQVLQRRLRERQQSIEVTDQQVRHFYDANAADYSVPERRRVAMLRIPVAADADEAAWSAAEAEAGEALKAVQQLDDDVRHFGALAREYSDDQASRYRGGVVGWISQQQASRSRHDPAMLEAGFALAQPGEVSVPVRGSDAVYLVRLVDLEPARTRPFEDLAAGIRQRLLQERMDQSEDAFRRALIARLDVEVNEDALAAIAPLSPAADPSTPEPPALPSEG